MSSENEFKKTIINCFENIYHASKCMKISNNQELDIFIYSVWLFIVILNLVCTQIVLFVYDFSDYINNLNIPIPVAIFADDWCLSASGASDFRSKM